MRWMRLSVSVEDADAQTDAEQPLFRRARRCRPAREAGTAAGHGLVPSPGGREAVRLLQLQEFFAGLQVLGMQDVAAAGLGAPDAVAVRAGGHHA